MNKLIAENPTAKDCLVARHDQMLASLVKEHAKALPEKIVLNLVDVQNANDLELLPLLFYPEHQVTALRVRER